MKDDLKVKLERIVEEFRENLLELRRRDYKPYIQVNGSHILVGKPRPLNTSRSIKFATHQEKEKEDVDKANSSSEPE